jgi:UDP-GlcNAc:undecaprenyl-phosphate GlcNAc-1-phosphate transferase
VLWLVGITNAFNIIDIMDGLAAGTAVISCVAMFAIVVALPGRQSLAMVATAALGGASLGFLRHNFFPARIYLGDAGSYLLGALLGALALEISYASVNRVALLAPLLILWLPVFDTVLVMILRGRRRMSVVRASNDHFALRLVARGRTRKQAVLLAYLLDALFGLMGLLVVLVHVRVAAAIFALATLLSVALGLWLGRFPTPGES